MGFLTKLKPDFWDHDHGHGEHHVSFKRMWQINFLVAAVVTLIPLLLLATLALYHYERIPGDELSSMEMQIILFAGICVLVMLAVVYKGTVDQISRLYHYHLDQTRVLREVAYTHKLASLGRLASGVAHQINNPMAVVNEKAGLIEDILTYGNGTIDREKLKKLTLDIREAAKGAGTITHRLLGFARHLPMEPGPVNLGQLLHEVAGFLTHDAEYRAIDVKLSLLSKVEVIQSDRSLLEQAFFNIINNAVAAVLAKPGGSSFIEITVSDAQENLLQVVIADNGVGIQSKDLRHIFDPYYSTHADLGSGLGLSITHGIVHRLGGEIEIQSQEGQGTKVTVTLPAGLAEKSPAGGSKNQTGKYPADVAVEQVDQASESSDGPRVLLVDDDEDYVAIITERLGMRDIELEVAQDGLEALSKLEKHHYDTVILDMMMPGLGGMETLKRIRDNYPHMQVILQTGFTTAELQETAQKLGAAALLEKPVNLDILSNMIKAV
jgi:signal transduction histidine kinase